MSKKTFSAEARFGGIVKRQLVSVKNDLATIKGQLDQIGTAIDDLARRIEELEKVLKPQVKQKIATKKSRGKS